MGRSSAPSGAGDIGLIKRFRANRLLAMLVAAVLLSLLVAGGVFLLSRHVMHGQINRMVDAEGYQTGRAKSAQESVQRFIDEHGLTLSEVYELSLWEAENPYVILTLYAGRRMIFATGVSQDMLEDNPLENEEVESLGQLEPLLPLQFADGRVQAMILVYDEMAYYNMAEIAAILLGGLFFAGILFVLIHHKLRYVGKLKAETAILEGGDLSYPITVKGRDELGDLARQIEEMRLSLLRQQREQDQAQQANAELVTAMSHDLRTPLTSLLGYMDLVIDGRGRTPEEKERFLRSAHAKAYQIKEMSDALFDYFYVYSQPQEGDAFETAPAAELMAQVLGEKALELESHGFKVVQQLSDFPGYLKVHYPLLIRAFDNLFSNIQKYADSTQPVTITCRREGKQMAINLDNAVDPGLKARESTKIGLTTCQKAFDYHGGSFQVEESRKSFTVSVKLPLLDGIWPVK